MTRTLFQGKRREVFVLPCALLAAGLASWLVGESKAITSPPRTVMMKLMGRDVALPTRMTQEAASVVTSARVHAVFGAFVGLAAGLAGWNCARSGRRGAVAAVLGTVVGGLVGYGMAYCGGTLYYRYHESIDLDLVASLLLHAVVWGSIGWVAALAWWWATDLNSRQLPRVSLAGLLGAILGTVLFDLIGAMFFAVDETGEPISKTSLTRLLARLLVVLWVAVGLVLSVSSQAETVASQPLEG